MTRLNPGFAAIDGSAHEIKAITAVDRSTLVESIENGDIYSSLAHHQQQEGWFARDLIVVLQEWAERFDIEFKLNVPEIAIRVDVLKRSCFGHFRYGHNGFGLRGEVAINARYLNSCPDWQILGTLLHELLHAWQQAHGTPGKGNYHNHEFRNRSLMYGLVVDRDGHTRYLEDSAFTALLRCHGVRVPPLEVLSAPPPRERGESKLKKWSCGCTNVRCAKELKARCLACGREFQRAI